MVEFIPHLRSLVHAGGAFDIAGAGAMRYLSRIAENRQGSANMYALP